MTPIEHWRTLDNNGNVMPWYTRPCLAWLETLDLKDKRVFEYGCGVSTTWYRIQGAVVHGVDSNPEWANGQKVVTLKEDYIAEVMNYDPFDFIAIDGIYRDDCTECALKRLKKGGYLIADNFEQPSVEPHWPKTRELTKHLPMTIFKELEHYDWVTAMWENA